MATSKVALSDVPVKVSDGTTGVRMQSRHHKFCWAASTNSPADQSVCHLDHDVYVENKGPIWVWSPNGQALNIIVT